MQSEHRCFSKTEARAHQQHIETEALREGIPALGLSMHKLNSTNSSTSSRRIQLHPIGGPGQHALAGQRDDIPSLTRTVLPRSPCYVALLDSPRSCHVYHAVPKLSQRRLLRKYGAFPALHAWPLYALHDSDLVVDAKTTQTQIQNRSAGIPLPRGRKTHKTGAGGRE